MSANTSYQSNRIEIDRQLRQLRAELEKLDSAQSADKTNYGYAGRAAYVSGQVQTLVDFLKGDDE